MNPKNLLFAAALVAGVAVAAGITPSRTATPPTPPAGPLAAALAGLPDADRADLASLYGSLADAVERDDSVVLSTLVLAEGIGRSLDLAFDGRKLKDDGSVGEAIDAHIATSMGYTPGEIPDLVMTPVLRGKAAKALREVSTIAAAR